MKITLYKTTTCQYCKMETEFLESKGIQFEQIFVDQDPKAAQEMIALSGQMGVPLMMIEKDDGTKETILGFDQGKLQKALNLT